MPVLLGNLNRNSILEQSLTEEELYGKAYKESCNRSLQEKIARENMRRVGDVRFSKPKRRSKLTFLIESIKSFFRSKKYARRTRKI